MKREIGVIGGGMIGASMAALFAGNGYQVTLLEKSGLTEKAEQNCSTIFSDLVQHGLATPSQAKASLSRIGYTTDYALLANQEVLFECVFEQTPVKHAVYAEVEKHCKQLVAIASSTSAISPDELAEGFSNGSLRSKLVVAHPWNPPHLAPCVELVASQYTCSEALQTIDTVLRELHKKTVILKRSIPGFIGNRLQYAMLREAIHIVEEGAATPEMVDETLKYSFAPRYTEIGIFEHFDNCGQDLTCNICDYLFPDLCIADQAQASVRTNVAEGNLGVKTGRGMLDWSKTDIHAFRERAAKPYYRFFDWSLPEN